MLNLWGFFLVLALDPAAAAVADECQGNATCRSQQEDASMIQMASKCANAALTPHSNAKSFARNSKPFVRPEGHGLSASEQGALSIEEDGVTNTYYLPGASILNNGKTVKYLPPWRYYLMKRPTTNYSNPDDFYKPDFMGKTFSVDIDFGDNGPGCGCNLNFYLVDMPVAFPGKDNDYYCDAQCFPDMGCCSEFDMNEGNVHVQQITNHACTKDYEDHPDWVCNKWGNPTEKTNANDFGHGFGAKINSRKPFTYSQKFENQDGEFVFTTTMSQEGREVKLTLGPGNSQMNNMMKDLEKGMAFVTGYWFAEDMQWLDSVACGCQVENCNKQPAYISNWRITSNNKPVPTPGPAPPPGPAPGPVPGPVPGPGPAPAPSPQGGRCCWDAACSRCEDRPHDWCNQAEENCKTCWGNWCT